MFCHDNKARPNALREHREGGLKTRYFVQGAFILKPQQYDAPMPLSIAEHSVAEVLVVCYEHPIFFDSPTKHGFIARTPLLGED